jgi:hypothetical protein
MLYRWRDDADIAKDKDKQYVDDEKVKRPYWWYYSNKRLLHPLQVMVRAIYLHLFCSIYIKLIFCRLIVNVLSC